MQQVPIQSLPNQAFSIIFDNNRWDFTIKSTNGCMSVGLLLNAAPVLDNMRVVAGSFIIPSRYEEAGNFIFTTQEFQLPGYRQFNTTQYLFYASQAELDALRVPFHTLPIKASDFNPIAALPLRFSPQGY